MLGRIGLGDGVGLVGESALDSKQALLEELNRERNNLYKLLHDIPQDQLMQSNGIGGLSIAQVCGHLSAWEDRLLTILQQITQEGSGAPRFGEVAGRAGSFCRDGRLASDQFNEKALGRRKRWQWREYLNELVLTREESGWTLSHLSQERFNYSVELQTKSGTRSISPAQIVRQIIEHERMHRLEIEVSLNPNGDRSSGSKAH